MAKVVYAKPTGDGNWGFGTSFVELDNVEEELEKRKQQQQQRHE